MQQEGSARGLAASISRMLREKGLSRLVYISHGGPGTDNLNGRFPRAEDELVEISLCQKTPRSQGKSG